MSAFLAALLFVCVARAEPSAVSQELRRRRHRLVSLADERPGPRHVKWLRQIDVRRVPEPGR